ncbi:hypothetical protein HMPREF9005_2484, partial [Actinomyces sp. oral taxon 178 str. F0338]
MASVAARAEPGAPRRGAGRIHLGRRCPRGPACPDEARAGSAPAV